MSGDVVDLSARARARRLSWFVPTPTCGAIARAFDLCAATRTTGLVVGIPGCGKTAAARAYAAEHPHAQLITMGTRANTELAALGIILERLCGEAPPARAAADLHRMIVKALRFGPDAFRFTAERLSEEDGVKVLLIDEAHSISQSAADCIRDLADEVKVAVVFIGNLDLYANWFPTTARARIASEQFISRITVRLRIEEARGDDVRAIVGARGMTGEAELAFLARVAGCPGHLRAVDNVLKIATHNTGARMPRLDDLTTAARMCGLNLRSAKHGSDDQSV
jgi:DNA transposition AAA+ family ATPase